MTNFKLKFKIQNSKAGGWLLVDGSF